MASHTEKKQQHPVIATCFRKLVEKTVRCGMHLYKSGYQGTVYGSHVYALWQSNS